MIRTLTITTGTSKGRETYGWTIVRLRDSETGKLYRTMGGGYDRVGTVLADWLTDVCQDRLRAISDRAYYLSDGLGFHRVDDDRNALYGMTRHTDGRVTLDGGCGISAIERIAKASGVVLRSLPASPRGRTVGWMIDAIGECVICGAPMGVGIRAAGHVHRAS